MFVPDREQLLTTGVGFMSRKKYLVNPHVYVALQSGRNIFSLI